MSGYLALRPVRGIEDIEYNLKLLAQALQNIDGRWVQNGTVARQALLDDVQLNGGAAQFSSVSADNIDVVSAMVGGTPVATQSWVSATLSTELADYDTSAEVAASIAASIAAALADYDTSVEVAASIADSIADSVGDFYTKTETDALLPSAATTDTPGLVEQATPVADLGQTISDPPTAAEVQAISDKVDALLGVLRAAGILDT